ncbi:general stress protein 26 [Kribbella voronezhensis]|uniref:General stress protein 26 n=1 Tax=Kribbella voronezhensis TaxID=2512212 RepID=A0A4R7TI77_9ACTN|nr:pyridoxamine 5'-phosphate oxidase family protein [Kribbella voronezhensis]TDU91207.1 general stress protein 26 [Kribbella voronezhensis]
MSETDTPVSHIAQLVKRAKICMLTTMTADGKHVARPMALQEAEFDGDLWFFAYDDSAKAQEIVIDPQINVSFTNDKSSEWTSISGTAELVHDRAKAEDLWSPPLKAWFPDGLETEGLVLIKVHADSAEYWEGPSSKAVRLLGAARAAITRNPDNFPATNETVEL